MSGRFRRSQAAENSRDEDISDGDERSDEGSSGSEDDENYTDFHRIILQSVMNKGFADGEVIKEVFKEASRMTGVEIHSGPDFNKTIQKTVKEINAKIAPMDTSIRSAICEITGKRYYVYLSNVDSVVASMRKNVPKNQVEFYQQALYLILKKRKDFKISMDDCFETGRKMGPKAQLTEEKTKDIVQKLLEMQYLVKVPKSDGSDYDLTIGFRGAREMEQSLRESFPDAVSNCFLCKAILINGLSCPGSNCTVDMHRVCLTRFKQGLDEKAECVKCKTVWTGGSRPVVRVNKIEEEEPPAESSDEASE